MSDLARISLSLEESLLGQLDALTQASGYENRSEFVRDLIRDRIAHEQWDTGSQVLGTLTIVYNHHQRGLTETLVDLQHHCGEQVLASTHIHLSHQICAEMIMLKGTGAGITALANAIRKQRGVLHAELAIATTGDTVA